jgi:hypothetical protein
MVNIFAYRPTIVIARKDTSFTDCGVSVANTLRIVKIGEPFLSYYPARDVNGITGFERDQAYFYFASQNIDLEGIADNQIPADLQITPGTNVFASRAFAGIALQTVDFSTVGFDASNLLYIYKVGDPYQSYAPLNDINALSGFEMGEAYYGYALADMDLSAYLIPPIVVTTDVDQPVEPYHYYGTEATTDKSYYKVPVRFFDNVAAFPVRGEENIAYIAKAPDNASYYWDGAAYQQIGGGTSYSDEQAQDAVGTILSSEFTYDDATPQISINSIPYSKISGAPTIPTDTNIYNTDGTLAANRTITGNNKTLTLSGGRWEESKGADVASANNLTLGTDGNTFKITGATQINALTIANWQAGSKIHLIFSSTPTIKHNTAGGAGTAVILLSGGVDYVAAANDVLSLIYDGTSWHEVGRKLAVAGSGVNALAAIGSSPNANGATISGSTLNLQPASTSFGGVVTTGSQSFVGTKTFTSSTVFTGKIFYFRTSFTSTGTLAGTNYYMASLNTSTSGQTLTLPTPADGQVLIIRNENSAAWSIAATSGTIKDEFNVALTTFDAYSSYLGYANGTGWVFSRLGGRILYTPTSSTDNTYPKGTVTYDDNYQYFRTSTGDWKKIALIPF